MQLTSHQASDADVAFLLDVFVRAMRPHISAARGSWDEHKEQSQFLEQLQVQDTKIIRYDGEPVGFVMTVPSGPDVELHTLCIAPEHQGHGLGSAVTRQLIDDCRQRGVGLVLSVLRANTGARALYERLGFVVTEASPSHYRMRFVS